uniref:Protein DETOXIFICATION n=1 Tax=Oryza brachyantha TaxID=4533 RepID=J3NE15_ORYBR
MEELKLMRSLCLPISALNLLHYVKSMVTVLCMGLLGRDELAGGALAVGLTNVTGYSVLSGLALGLEPVAGQAFGGGGGGSLPTPPGFNLATLAFLWISLTWAGTAQKEPDEPTGSAEWADMAHFSEWAQLLRLSLPSCLSVCLEWWWYELMTITAGYLRDPAATLAAAAIVIQTTSLLYTISVTLSSAVSARVAYELGAGRPRSAHVSFVVAMGLAMVGSCVGLAWATLGRRPWVHVFTDDPTVQSLAASVLPVVGLCELANCPQTTGCGVLRGSARPVVGAAINLCSFYLVGAPVALVLAFGLDMGFLGLCLGLLSAQVVCLLCVGFATFQTDWEAEALKAFHLVGSGDDKGGLAQKENV